MGRSTIGIRAVAWIVAGTAAVLAVGAAFASDEGGGAELALDALKEAYAAMEADDLEGAEAAFRTALDRARTSELRFNAAFGLGSVLADTGRADEAEPFLTEAAELRPDRATAWVVLGDVRDELGRAEEAARAWTSALAADPDLPEVYRSLGRVLLELERPQVAERVYGQAIVRFPRDPEMRLGLGVARVRAGRAREAVSAFRGALELDPGNPRGLYGLGLAQLESGDLEAVRRTLTELESRDPELARQLSERLAAD